MTRLRSIVLLFFVFLTVALAFLYFSYRADEIRPIKVAIATWPGFASGFVGQDRGYFEGLDVEFVKMDESRARQAAFQSGQVDLMISSGDVFVQELAQGIRGVIVLVTDESFGADGIVAKPEIRSLVDLRSNRVAFARATPSHYLLYKVLQRAGLSPADVQQIVVEDPGHAGQAFLGGSVDAAVTWEPLLSEVRSAGKGHVLATTRDLPGIIVDVLVASADLTDDEDRLRSFIKGWMASVRYVRDNPEEGARIIARGLGIPQVEAQGMMEGLKFAGAERNAEFLCGNGVKPRLKAVIEDAAAFWLSQKIISIPPNLDGSISRAFCETLKQ